MIDKTRTKARRATTRDRSTGHERSLIRARHTAVAGRARLFVPGLYRNVRLKQKLERELPGRSGVNSASASVWTGNVAVQFDRGIPLSAVIAGIEAIVHNARLEPRTLEGTPERGHLPRGTQISKLREGWHIAKAVLKHAAHPSGTAGGPLGFGETKTSPPSWHTLSGSPKSGFTPSAARP